MNENIEIRHETGYGLIHRNVMRDRNLDVEAKAIYSYISSFAGTSGQAYPGVSLMCDELNMSERRYKKYRKQLEDRGYLTIERKRTSNGFSKNLYTLHHIPVSVQIVPVRNVTVQNVSVQNDSTNNNSSNINSINNNSNNINTSASDNAQESQLINEFNEWYELYDKKKDRKAAFTKFKTARKKHSFEQIINGTKEYLKTISNKQFQKYPKTFLHNESYLEEYSDSYVDAEPLTGNVFNELRNEFQ